MQENECSNAHSIVTNTGTLDKNESVPSHKMRKTESSGSTYPKMHFRVRPFAYRKLHTISHSFQYNHSNSHALEHRYKGVTFETKVPRDAAERGYGTFPIRIPSSAFSKSRVTKVKKSNGGRSKRASTSGKDIFLAAISPSNSLSGASKRLSKRSEQYLRARAKFSYVPGDDNEELDEENRELAFMKGDVIVILDKDTDPEGWWKGSLNGKTGLFPHNYVEIIEQQEQRQAPVLPKRTSSRYSKSAPKIPKGWTLHKATWTFEKTEDEEMSFKEGELILIQDKSIEEAKDQTEGDIFWWLGQRFGGKETGFVPSSYLVRV